MLLKCVVTQIYPCDAKCLDFCLLLLKKWNILIFCLSKDLDCIFDGSFSSYSYLMYFFFKYFILKITHVHWVLKYLELLDSKNIQNNTYLKLLWILFWFLSAVMVIEEFNQQRPKRIWNVHRKSCQMFENEKS